MQLGETAIIFLLANLVVIVLAFWSPARVSKILAGVLFAMWLTTKIWDFSAASDEGIYLDSALWTAGALVFLAVLALGPSERWRRVLASCGLLAVALIAAFARYGRDAGPQVCWWHQLACNVLYAIAQACAATPGLSNAAMAFRAWLSGDSHSRPWSRPGARWGRDDPVKPWRYKGSRR